MFISLHQLNGCVLAGRKSLSHWCSGSLPSYKSDYKNHLQNQLRCRPYGCEFNKDKLHLLTAAGSLGFIVFLAFSSITPFPCIWALCPFSWLALSICLTIRIFFCLHWTKNKLPLLHCPLVLYVTELQVKSFYHVIFLWCNILKPQKVFIL